MYSEFKNKNIADQVSIIPEEEVLRKITSDLEIQQKCSMIRALTENYLKFKEIKYRDDKEKSKANLAAFIPSGEFSYRKGSSITKYWGRIVIDIDNHKDPERLKAKIKSEKEASVIMAFLSPSGTGLKVIHQLDYPDLKSTDDIINFHKQAYRTIVEYYKKKYKVEEIDKSGSDLARLCYYSHDPSAYYNSDAKGWSFNYQNRDRISNPIISTKIDGYYNTFTNDTDQANLNLVNEIIHWCKRENISLLDNYNDWIRALFALKNTFTESTIGQDLFLQLSATSPKFKRDECENKWEATNPSNTECKVTLGTILYMAKRCGWLPTRRVYIGTGASLNSCVTALEESNLRLKYNSLTHQLLFSEEPSEELWQLANDYIEGKVKMDILKLALKREEFDGFIKYVPPRFNHIDEFIHSLPKWDNIDRFPELLQTLTIKGKEDNALPRLWKEDNSLPRILVKKWMIGVINGLHNRPENAHKLSISPNENLLILIGPQGIGKTRWMRKLMPESWHTLFAEKLSFNFEDKDDKLLACEKAIISMDELSPILNNKATNEQLKGFLSQRTFNIRVAYGRYNNVFFKIASFIGTSNHNEIITDPTGSRRFWPIEIEAADYEHNVNMQQLWAQTYALWKAGEKHWLCAEEQEMLSAYNEPFIKSHPYEEYISRYVAHGNDPLTATQIAEHVNSCVHNNNAVNPRQLGVYLKKAGFQRVSRWIDGATHRVYDVYLIPESNLIEATPLEVVDNHVPDIPLEVADNQISLFE